MDINAKDIETIVRQVLANMGDKKPDGEKAGRILYIVIIAVLCISAITVGIVSAAHRNRTPESTNESGSQETPENPDNGETPDNPEEGEKDHSKCLEEASGWKRFWNAIGNFFRGIFSKYVKCVCGDKVLKEDYAEFKRIFKANK